MNNRGADHELIVTVSGNDVKTRSHGGAEKTGKILLDHLRRETIEVFQDWLSEGKISHRRELEVLGGHLFEALFNGDVLSLFEEKLRSVPIGDKLRVQLSFDEDAVVPAGLPWEYLY